jgi:drug/metabolite transporter (DMT)-like permease
MTDPRQRQLLVLCLATVYIVWGTSYMATRVGVLHLPPLLFGGLRFVLGGSLLLVVALWRGFRPAQLTGQWNHVLMMSLLGVAGCNGLHVWALQWVPSQTSALLNASSALWIVVFGLFGARAHRPGLHATLGLLIGFAGTALLIWPGAHTANVAATPVLPQLVILTACVIWSIGTIYMRNHTEQLDLVALVALQMLIGGVWMALFGMATGELTRWNWDAPGMLALAYLTVFSSCFAYLAYAWLARHATPAQVGTYSYVNPALAAVVGFVALGERLSPLQMLGGAVILGGLLMINWPERFRAA